MENLTNIAQAVIVWCVVFAPCLAIVLAAFKKGAAITDEQERIA